MPRTRFDIDGLLRDAACLARVVPAERLFGWLARSVTIPAGWVALATRAGLDPRIVPPGGQCDDVDLIDVLFVRDTLLDITCEHADLTARDGFATTGRLVVPIRILTDPAELRALRSTLLRSAETLTPDALRSHLEPALRRALAELAQQHDAAALVAGVDPALVRGAVQRCAGPVCLTSGLTLAGTITAAFTSPDWERHQQQEAQIDQRRRSAEARAQMQEALAASQRQRVDQMLTLVESLSKASADGRIELQELLTGFSDAERGQLYAALWHTPSATKTRFVAALTSQELLRFEPTQFQRPAQRIRLPETLGPLRSISPGPEGSSTLLIGAARGVYEWSLESGQITRTLLAPIDAGKTVQGGFNAAASDGEHLLATHSELGVIAWRLSEGDTAPFGAARWPDLTQKASAVRCARSAGGFFWFTVDATLYAARIADPDSASPACYAGASATLSAIAFEPGVVYAADVAGRITAFDIGDPESRRIIRNPTGQPVESIHVIDTAGITRLLIADRNTGLTAMVLGDQYTRRYEAGNTIIRRAAAAPDLFVAMNDARDRLIAWDPRRADAPIATVIIPYLTGANLQDVAIVAGDT